MRNSSELHSRITSIFLTLNFRSRSRLIFCVPFFSGRIVPGSAVLFKEGGNILEGVMRLPRVACGKSSQEHNKNMQGKMAY